MACCPGRSNVYFSWVLYVSWQAQDSAAKANFKTDHRSDRHQWRLLLSSILLWPYIPKCLYERLLIRFAEDLLFNVLSSHMTCFRLFNPQALFWVSCSFCRMEMLETDRPFSLYLCWCSQGCSQTAANVDTVFIKYSKSLSVCHLLD